MFGKNRSLVVGRFASIVLFLFLLSLLASSSFSADSTSFDPTKVVVTAKGGSGIPVGTIISWPVAANPADFQNSDGSYNWLECNGQNLDPTVYPELSAVVGPSVPDLRGLFLRGYGSQTHAQNNGSTVGLTSTLHTSGALGQVQGDATRNIQGSLYYDAALYLQTGIFGVSAAGGDGGIGGSGWSNGVVNLDASRIVPTAPENRPVNAAVRYLIRSNP